MEFAHLGCATWVVDLSTRNAKFHFRTHPARIQECNKSLGETLHAVGPLSNLNLCLLERKTQQQAESPGGQKEGQNGPRQSRGGDDQQAQKPGMGKCLIVERILVLFSFFLWQRWGLMVLLNILILRDAVNFFVHLVQKGLPTLHILKSVWMLFVIMYLQDLRYQPKATGTGLIYSDDFSHHRCLWDAR